MKTLFRLLLVFCWFASATLGRAGEAEDATAAAKAAMQRSDFDGAIANYSTAIRLNPKDGQSYYYRAWSYGQKGDWKAAIADCSAVLALNPTATGAYYLRAMAYANQKDFNHAFTDANAAVQQDPHDSAIVCLRGQIFGELGDADNALADFNLSLQLDPKNSFAYAARARWHQDRGEAALTANDLTESLRLNPDDEDVLNQFAWLLATSPDQTARNGAIALQYAQKACELSHWKNEAYLDTLAAAYAEIGDFEEAIKWQQKAVARAPQGEHAKELAEHLELYRKKQPCRESPKVKSGAAVGPAK